MKVICFFRIGPAIAGVLLLLEAVATAAALAPATDLRLVPPGIQVTNLIYASAPIDNPLKGLVPCYYNADKALFPHSVEYNYVALGDVMIGPTNFTWTVLDSQINGASSNGCQFAVRMYIDFPGKSTIGIPQYLLDGGLIAYHYSDYGNVHSVSPNYGDTNLQKALTNFIAAFGARYDNDPRIAFIELGLLGFWGQWGTWPDGSARDPGMAWASTNVQTDVMNAYVAAFTHTKLLMPEPYKAGGNPTNSPNDYQPIGYHDDLFSYKTMGPLSSPSWFSNLLWAANCLTKWQTQVIGGETAPNLWSCLWDSPSCTPTDQAFDACVQVVHTTWLLDTSCFTAAYAPNTDPAARARALASVRKMGYELYVPSFSTWSDGTNLMAGIRLKNTGVAPFYYDWQIELAAATSGGQILRKWPTPWIISGILPGKSADLQTALSNPPASGFTLLMRVINPLSSAKPLRFANTSQDATIPGWLTLGVTQ